MKNILKSTTFLAIVACWLWSTAFAGVKIGLQYHTPFQFAGFRFIISGLLILLVFRNWGRFYREIREHWQFVVLIGLIQVFAQYALFYSGMNLVPGALGAMIVGSSPLFVALVAHFTFHNDRMNGVKTASILVGVAGIAIITLGRQKVELKGALEWLGIVLLLLNNLVSGYSNVLVAKSKRNISPVVLSSSSLLLGGLLLFLISVPIEGFPQQPFPLEYYVALGWLGFLSAAALTIWYALLGRSGVKVSLLNTWKFLIPVSGALLSWMLLSNEKPDWASAIGMAFIAVSLVLLNRGRNGR